ncbi:MAG: FAD-dependent oxidoreductase [Actinomycetota bacterium]
MARTPVGRMLNGLVALDRESRRTGIPPDELDDMRAERSPGGPPVGRRDFLRKAAKSGAALAAAPALAAALAACSKRSSEGQPEIVIVGAGLSGMTAAFRLMKAGHRSTIYEAADRLTGRSWTLRNFFDNGQYVEHGGEFINSDHKAIIDLATIELLLDLDDLWVPWPAHTQSIYHFNGRRYDRHQAFLDYQQVHPALRRDLHAAPWPPLWDKPHSKEEQRLDNMSLEEWIDKNVPGGLRSDFGKLVAVAYTGEYALDPGDQSALNLMYEMGYSPKSRMQLYGDQDYRFQIEGGNDQVVTEIAKKLPEGSTVLESPLVAITKNSDDTVTCTFDQSGSTVDVKADKVILCLPFRTLQNVDFSKAGFEPLKVRCINEFGMGTNAKVHMQFGKRFWYGQGNNGVTLSDTGYESTWEEDMGKLKGPGTLVSYTGGSAGTSFGDSAPHAATPEEISGRVLGQLDPVFPGAKQRWNGKSYLDYWAKDPWHFGSYACYKPGQWTEFLGYQKVPQGNIHFAGEHTSVEWQGFLNGAVESGNRAAREIIDSIG